MPSSLSNLINFFQLKRIIIGGGCQDILRWRVVREGKIEKMMSSICAV